MITASSTGLFLALCVCAAVSVAQTNSRVTVTIPTKTQGDATTNIHFQNCTPERPKDWKTTSHGNFQAR
jgi:hypothetical protein